MMVTFKCGHVITLKRDVKEAPVCPECGERIVKQVTGAQPVFRGACSGPLVQKGQP